MFTKRFKQYTPDDDYAFIGPPPMKCMIPDHKEIHISCNFTWDKKYCEELAYQWEGISNMPVKIGGPAFGSEAHDFHQGMYVKKNIIFTTRGCNNNCPWCCVPKLEGKLRELPICQGNVIQDNNFLQASILHKEKVFEMLRTQKGICFKGGLEAGLIDDHFIRNITSLRIKELWLACDTDGAFPGFKKACEKLTRAGFTRSHIHCYVLIGKDIEKDEERLQNIYNSGAMPFAMLYRDFSDKKKHYGDDYEKFARQWQRPASINMHMTKGSDYRDFNK